MTSDVKALIESTPLYRALVRVVVEKPYIERQELSEKLNASEEELEQALTALGDKLVVLELASQADSSVESRVPKRVYLINPEIEAEIRKLL